MYTVAKNTSNTIILYRTNETSICILDKPPKRIKIIGPQNVALSD